MSKKSFVGIYLFGIFLILSSLNQMLAILQATSSQHAQEVFSYMPEWMVTLRFVISWLQRIIGLIAGIGILMRKNLCRLTAMALGWLTIFAGPWKHSYRGFVEHGKYLDQKFGPTFQGTAMGNISFASPVVARSASLVSWGLDILFWGIFIFYFTRPLVKAQFVHLKENTPLKKKQAGRIQKKRK